MRVFSALYLFLSVMGLSAVAWADPGLPSDFGPVSIAAARRELEAKVRDWNDDREENKSRRVLSCAMAHVEGVILPSVAGSLAPLLVLHDLPRYLGAEPGDNSQPLYLPLEDLSKEVTLTAEEKQNLKRLMEREVTDQSDRIRLVIDTQGFLMRVSGRLYQEQIDLHVARAQGFFGFFRFDREYCDAYTLGAERDAQMVKAAYRIQAFYNFLEQELGD